jgi:parvulin-like peptidyl-prolyl isomerase
MAKRIVYALCLVILLILNGCGAKEQTTGKPKAKEPDFVTVQHILIAFSGSVPDDDVTRTQEEAEQLAQELYQRAESGEDFDMLVEEYTDDSFPGVYQMANDASKADPSRTIFAREKMAESFGDVSFSLEVGEFGLANYDPEKSKYGWHIILRIK